VFENMGFLMCLLLPIATEVASWSTKYLRNF
jgi:hypothetical protein